VLQRYVDNPAANAETKIPRPDGSVWHRTGDAGRLDAQGRLWLEGRVKDVVAVSGVARHTLALEKALDRLPGVTRSALVSGVDGRPALVIAGPHIARDAVRSVRERLGFTALSLYRIDEMPVDGRHNSKIDRPALRDALARGALAALGEV
jgi:acyl-coenzyme A synthetase/AMP-(fatty) acid ligase